MSQILIDLLDKVRPLFERNSEFEDWKAEVLADYNAGVAAGHHAGYAEGCKAVEWEKKDEAQAEAERSSKR